MQTLRNTPLQLCLHGLSRTWRGLARGLGTALHRGWRDPVGVIWRFDGLVFPLPDDTLRRKSRAIFGRFTGLIGCISASNGFSNAPGHAVVH